MNATLTPVTKTRTEIAVTVPADEAAKARAAVVREFAAQAALPGFPRRNAARSAEGAPGEAQPPPESEPTGSRGESRKLKKSTAPIDGGRFRMSLHSSQWRRHCPPD